MIQPKDRSTLTEVLVPPAGYNFDTGVATTYSLDLGTLITLPVQLAWLATSDDPGSQRDPIRLLEGLRRTAKRLSVFSDRGRLHIPRIPHALMGLMEEMVHEVMAPHGGAFHPKVWVLRFLPEDSRKEACIRLLILSRNLTDDRSWDLSLCLEGKPQGGIHKVNREIAGFLRSLPGWSTKRLSAARLQDIESLASDLHRCKWELPGAFEQIEFHVLGVGKKPRAFQFTSSDQTVIISPFLSNEAIGSVLGSNGMGLALVSRPEELSLLSEETRSKFERIDVMNDDADTGSEEELSSGECRGLHAKAIVQRRGWWTSAFIGSANCTNAALLRGVNVEVVAELTGKASKVGGPADWISERGMGPLLQPFSPISVKDLLEQRSIEDALERARQFLIRADLTLQCTKADGGYQMKLMGADVLEGLDAEVWAWPLTVPRERQIAVDATSECDLGIYASQDVTSLTGFRIRVEGGDLSFGLELPLANPPLDREAGVLALILRNRAEFLRYLLLLLGEPEDALLKSGDSGGTGWLGSGRASQDAVPLFEMLLRAFSRDPGKLSQIATAIGHLEKAESASGETLVPEEFMKIWRTFEEARKLDSLR